MLTLTGPFGVLLMPAVAIAIALRRLRPAAGTINWPIVVTYFVAVAVQTVVMLRHPQAPKGVHDVPWVTWMTQAMFTDFLPSVLATTMAGYLFAALLIGVCVLSRARLLFAWLLYFSVLLWGLGITRVAPPVQIAWYGTGARYVYPWGIFMLWTLTLSIVNTRITSLRPIAAVLIFVILLASGERFEAQLLQQWEIRSGATSYHVTVPPGWSIDVAR
ncbi:hypothetical protein [Paraburkholderia podalyriae]|uniref:hypothetical protein n=1 Tax=Paraburkholderia podalyriae TaxID=1938811 RepID=UPI001FE72C02|nr:hypothetical protein [Paraburkholderia podalyriae]